MPDLPVCGLMAPLPGPVPRRVVTSLREKIWYDPVSDAAVGLCDATERLDSLHRAFRRAVSARPPTSRIWSSSASVRTAPSRSWGRTVVNFGSDSFLGLDQDLRVKDAIRRGVERWGAHNGASRAFSSVRANIEAEEKLAPWLGTEATLIYPSVTLANMGAIPGLVGRQDLLVVDEQAHNSIQEGAKIAKANGARVESFSHCDPVAPGKGAGRGRRLSRVPWSPSTASTA